MRVILDGLIDKKKGFEALPLIEKVKYLAYFYVRSKKDEIFTPSNIDDFFELARTTKPANMHDLFNKLVAKNTFIKMKNGFTLQRNVIKELDKEFSENSGDDGNVFYVSGEEPWTDRNKRFSTFVSKLKGEIIVIDGYYGLGTFHLLDNFNNGQKIRFLTAQLGNGENQDKISKELVRFKREFPKMEFKKYSKFYELHDRYILSDNFLVWIGHGMKDFGDKECFLIAIPTDKISAIVSNLKSRFEEKWSKSNNLT